MAIFTMSRAQDLSLLVATWQENNVQEVGATAAQGAYEVEFWSIADLAMEIWRLHLTF